MGLLRKKLNPYGYDEDAGFVADGDNGGMLSDSEKMQNPIAGTPFDPNRRAWMRSMGQPADAGVEGTEVGASAPAAAVAPAQPAATAPAPVPAPSAATATPASLTSNAPEMTAASAANPRDMSESPEDALFRRMMEQNTMDDTPSQERINRLQGEYDHLHQTPSVKQRLIKLAIMAAPTIISAIAGGGDAAGAAAGGTLEAEKTMHDRNLQQQDVVRQQLEGERQRQERQFERKLQMPIAYGNMKSIQAYRQGQVNARNVANENTASKNANTHADTLTRMGLDENGNPLPIEQLPAAVQGRISQQRAHSDLYKAQVDMAEAREELLRAQNDPSSPLFQQKQKQYEAALMQARAAMSRAESMGLSSEVRAAQYYMRAFGTDAQGNVLPGTFNDTQGNPLGWGAPGNPTANTKQRGQTAATVLQHFHTDPRTGQPGLTELIQQTPDASLGGLAGHVNEWLIGQYGMNDPALASLRTNLMLADTAMMLSHVGQSGGIAMLDHFKSMLNLGQGKSNLLASLGGMEGWMKGYEGAGTPQTTVGAPSPNFSQVPRGGGEGTTAPKGAGRLSRTPTSPAPGPSNVVKWGKDPRTGKPKPVTIQ